MALTTASLVLAGGTAAYAYWSASGTGSAALQTASATAITVGATPSGALYPGASAGVTVTLGNPNAYPVKMTHLSAVSVSAAADDGGCPASWITVNIVPGPAPGHVLPNSGITVSSGSSGTVTLANVVTMSATAPNACQGKTFTVTMTFTGEQQAA